MKKIIYIIVFILLVSSAISDDTDSLIKSLSKSSGKEKYDNFKSIISLYLSKNTDSARFFARQYLNYASSEKNPEQVSTAQRLLGASYFYEGDLQNAEKYFREAYNVAKRNDLEEMMGDALNNMAIIFSEKGDYNKAIDNYKIALDIKTRAGNDDAVAMILLNIGNIHFQMGEYNIAMEHFNEVLQISNKVDNKSVIAMAYNNLGNTYENLDSLEKAKDYNKKSIHIKKEIGDIRGMANSLNNIANINMKLEEYELALPNALNALNLQKELNDNTGVVTTKNTIGEIYLKLGNTDSAIVYLMESLELSQKLNLVKYEKDNFLSISESFAQSGNYEMAYEFYKKYKAISDSIISQEEREHISELSAKYKSEKMKSTISTLEEEKESSNTIQLMLVGFIFLALIIAIIIYIQLKTKARANELLEEKNREIENQKEEYEKLNIELSKSNNRLITLNENLVLSQKELKETNATKDKFFSIVAHDLKNSIASFLTSSELITLYYDKLDKDKILQQLNRMNASALNLRILLENLVQWANSKTGKLKPELEKVNINHIVDQCISVNEQSAINKQIRIEKEIVDEIYAIADPNMLKTVIRNLISNAIKFTEPNGFVKVFSNSNNNKINISVKDNGVGMTREETEKLFKLDSHFSKKGTNNEAGTGLGLILCKEFIEFNNGELFVDSTLGKGTDFTFTLNKS